MRIGGVGKVERGDVPLLDKLHLLSGCLQGCAAGIVVEYSSRDARHLLQLGLGQFEEQSQAVDRLVDVLGQRLVHALDARERDAVEKLLFHDEGGE